MDGILHDIRVGIRVLARSPGATTVCVLALALGVGANTVTFSSVRALVPYPLPFHDTQPVYDVKIMEQFLDEQLSGVRISTWMMEVFAVIALALAASGVYGVISYSVARRTHEIGIRLALGAAGSQLRGHILAQAMRPVVAGIVLGTAAPLALERLMSSAPFGVVVLEPVTFGGVLVLLGASALAAGYIPARHASAVNPVVALREE